MRLATLWAMALLVLASLPSRCAADDDALSRRLSDGFDRRTSDVTVQVLRYTSRAAVEYSATYRNPTFHDPIAEDAVGAPGEAAALSGLSFGGALSPGSLADRSEETPLTEQERERPCAWAPMLKYLSEWNWDAAKPMVVAASRITRESWGNSDLGRPLAQPVLAFLHGEELWVKVELHPVVTWATIDDEDGDGYGELYGQMDIGPERDAILAHLREDYLGRELTDDQLTDCLFALASAWYPSRRTTLLEPGLTRPWPNDETEPEVRDELQGATFEGAFAVLRSSPYDKPIYNVFLRASTEGGEGAPAPPPAPPAPGDPDPWAAEASEWGGSFDAWAQGLATFRADVKRLLAKQPEQVKGLEGLYGFLFFRGDLEYLLAGNLRQQPNERDPYPAIVDFHNQLAERGIDMLMVFIPSKAEVYPEAVAASGPEGGRPYAQPYCRELMSDLAEAGVDIVDLLPAFVDDRRGDELLYQLQDTHWTNRGVRLAARLLGERIRQYAWYAELSPKPGAYGVRPVTFSRLGDTVPMLAPDAQPNYRPAQLEAEQVVGPTGVLYEDDEASPIAMLGDSFTGVFELEDCGHAGLSAHVAKGIGLPVDLIMAQGSGPTIRGRLARRGAAAIDAKRLVIWTVASRDLYNYWSPWRKVELPR